jgi:hypothetical protein
LFVVSVYRRFDEERKRAKFKQHNKSEEAAGVFLLAFSCLNRRIQIRQFRAWKVTNFRLERVRLKNKSGTQFSCIRSFHSRKLKNVCFLISLSHSSFLSFSLSHYSSSLNAFLFSLSHHLHILYHQIIPVSTDRIAL